MEKKKKALLDEPLELPPLKLVSCQEDVIPIANQRLYRKIINNLKSMSSLVEGSSLPKEAYKPFKSSLIH